MKRILINAERESELRVALVEDDRLYDLCIESDLSDQKKANIYKGIITRVEHSLEAVFVDYGETKQGFLPFKDISIDLYPECEGNYEKLGEVLKPEQTLIVQVEKEERGNKGASLTTNISLAGQYLILIPYSSKNRTNGVSRSVPSEDRKEVRELLEKLVIPEDTRVIVRTSGAMRTPEELQWNLDYLVRLWETLKSAYEQLKDDKKSHLLYREGNAISRTLRDYLKDDINEVVIDSEETYKKIKDSVTTLMPSLQERVIRYEDYSSIFAHYKIEEQVETVYHRRVSLPSGGEIVIDPTEALVSIDVNSGKSTQGKDVEETALMTNLEATAEIVRQIRLRDLGGLIVVDFIDMGLIANRRKIEETFERLSKDDRAKIKIGRISRFGLLELSRQHLGSPITNLKSVKCSECGNMTMVRSTDSQIESILGLIETRANAKGISQIQVQLPVDGATYLLNEKREELYRIENRHGIKVLVIANEQLTHPNYFIRSVAYGETNNEKTSYQYKRSVEKKKTKPPEKKHSRKAIIDDILPDTAPKKKGFLARLFAPDSTAKNKSPEIKEATKLKEANEVKKKKGAYKPRYQNRNRNRSQNPNRQRTNNNQSSENRTNNNQSSNDNRQSSDNKTNNNQPSNNNNQSTN